jgi:hypothetical protein
MPFIGKQPIVGNFQVCDAISVVNGQAAYTLQVGSANVEPETANHILVSLNGVLQKPGSSFTISGSTLTFASNLATGDVIDFVILLGDVLNIGAPSDDTVATASIQDNAVTAAKLASGVGSFTLGTPVTASGSNVTFSSIPSTARLIMISFSGLSHNHSGNADLKVILGDSGGLETSGYTSNVVYTGSGGGIGGANYTNGHTFYYSAPNSTTVYGIVFITAIDTTNHIYAISSQAGASSYIGHAAGSKSLSSVLTQIQVQSSSGALDAGTLNIMYL